MNETDLMNNVRLELSQYGFAVFRANVGKVRLTDGDLKQLVINDRAGLYD